MDIDGATLKSKCCTSKSQGLYAIDSNLMDYTQSLI
jgi:hypothetical protein